MCFLFLHLWCVVTQQQVSPWGLPRRGHSLGGCRLLPGGRSQGENSRAAGRVSLGHPGATTVLSPLLWTSSVFELHISGVRGCEPCAWCLYAAACQVLVCSRGRQLCFLAMCHSPSGVPVVGVLGGGEQCCCERPLWAVQGRLGVIEQMRGGFSAQMGVFAVCWVKNTLTQVTGQARCGNRPGGLVGVEESECSHLIACQLREEGGRTLEKRLKTGVVS